METGALGTLRPMRDLIRSLWSEPRPPSASGPGRGDAVLLAAFVAAAAIEVVARAELTFLSPVVLGYIALMPTLLWRRSHPMLMAALAFGAMTIASLAGLAPDGEPEDIIAALFIALLPYSLLRWGSGREAVLGPAVVLGLVTISMVATGAPATDFLGGFTIMLACMAIGAAVRFQGHARAQEIEQVKLREREQLARDLHDTVAHHVSAIAIRAQAGLVVAPKRPEAAAQALEVIAAEASRTLSEMREMVRVLREDDAPPLAPGPRISDLEGLAAPAAEGPCVDVSISGDVDDVPPAVSAAIYRLAQESVTNARRHARRPTRIDVRVTADEDSVRLQVRDDGEGAASRSPSPSGGFGVRGMRERVALLGGTCDAGPGRERGWTVTAVLPRRGPAV